MILAEQWDDAFVSYGLVREPGATVRGTVWLLTECQRAAVRKWELEGLWSHDARNLEATVDLFGLSIPVRAVSELVR